MTRSRTPWSSQERAAIVGDYVAMLRDEIGGREYSKAAHRNSLRPHLDGRSDSAIEMKHRNISAVLAEQGLRYVSGYKPLANYQRDLSVEIDRWLEADSILRARLASGD